MSIWTIMLATGAVTLLIRLSFILVLERLRIPVLVRRALRFVPPAILTAIIVPELILSGGHVDLMMSKARVPAGVVAALIAWRTRNILLSIAAGMLVLFGLQWLIR